MEKRQKLPMSVILGYSAGSLAFNHVQLLTNQYVNVFFTNVMGLSLASVGLIMLIGRIWDGFNDPIMGSIVDRTRTRNGRYRPYLIWGIIPLCVASILLYLNPGLDGWLLTAYAGATYILFGMAYTFGNVPYLAMMATITRDPDERTKVVTIRSAFMMLAMLFPMLLIPRLAISADGVNARGFQIVAGIGVLFIIVFAPITYRATRDLKYMGDSVDTITWRNRLDAIVKNRPLILVSIAWFVTSTLEVLRSSTTYFVLNVLERGDLVFTFTVAAVPTMCVCMCLMPLVMKLEKKNVMLFGLGLYIAGSFVWYFVSDASISVMILLYVIREFGFGFCAIIIWSLITDCVDYATVVSGKHQGGIVSSTATLMKKTAGGIGGLLLNFSMKAAGFAPLAEHQTAAAAHGMKVIMTLMCGVIALLGFAAMLFYPLSKRRMAELAEAIDEQSS